MSYQTAVFKQFSSIFLTVLPCLATGCMTPLGAPTTGLNFNPGLPTGGTGTSSAPVTLSSVNVSNNILTLKGTSLDTVASVQLSGNGFNIISQTANQLLATANSSILIAVGTAYNLLITSAEASSTTITFTLPAGSVTPALLSQAYLPIAGGTMTGVLQTTGVANLSNGNYSATAATVTTGDSTYGISAAGGNTWLWSSNGGFNFLQSGTATPAVSLTYDGTYGYLQTTGYKNSGPTVIAGDNGYGFSGAGGYTWLWSSSGGFNFGVSGGANLISFDSTGDIIPNTTNTASLGTAAKLWSVVYAQNGAIQTSDGRLKASIAPSDLGLEFIRQLKPVSYRWKAEPMGVTHYGFIAQDVEATLKSESSESSGPSAAIVHYDAKADRYGLSYTEFISPLVKATQEIYEKLAGLLASRDQLSAQISALQADNAAMKNYLCAKDPKAPFCGQ